MKCRHFLPPKRGADGKVIPERLGDRMTIICRQRERDGISVEVEVYEVLPDGSVGVFHEEFVS